MKHIILLFLVFFVVTEIYSQKIIRLNARDEIVVDADEMIIGIYIETEGAKIDSINMVQHQKALKILDVLAKFGYKKDNIYFIESSISESFNRYMLNENFPNETNYSATQGYKIKLKEFDMYDTIKNELTKNGITRILIESFETSEYDKLKSKVYKQALEKAKKKAKELLAGLNNYNLVIKEIREPDHGSYRSSGLTFQRQMIDNGLYDLALADLAPMSKIKSTVTSTKVSIPASFNVIFEIIEK
jgi:uncharacterized protein YggE